MIDLFSPTELKRQKEQNYKTIYEKPKSLLRALIQKLFIKILFKLFPKKFSSNKNKIRLIMNIGARRSYLFLVSSYLRFRYPRYFILPSTQIYAVGIAIKFLEILKPQNIDFFLMGGSLLGAVRQGSFAGRPKDIDFGIKEDKFPKLLDAIPLLKKNGAKFIRERFYNNKVASLQIEFPCMLVDISIYRKKNVEGKKVCDNVLEGDFHETPKGENFVYKFHYSTLSLDNLVPIKVYGREFLAPPNPEIYLERKYGKNWRIPDKKQFYWNKKN
jgi:hypothetical protein